MKRNKILVTLLLVVVAVLGLASCNSKNINKYEDMASVTFVLNGGTFKNSNKDITYYYNLAEGKSCKVKTPSELSPESLITNGNKIIKGWYKDENFTQPWDFDNDLLNAKENIKIYIKWGYAVTYDFAIYYKDKDNKDVYLYNVLANEQTYKLNIDSATVREINKVFEKNNYTSLWEFEDSSGKSLSSDAIGNGYNVDVTHPGGEESLSVKVYIKAIEGVWKLARTYDDIKVLGTSNIYLLNDIDCKGKTLTYGDFKDHIFEGNGHTISNFVINNDLKNTSLVGNDFDNTNLQKNTGYISLFRNLSNSTIRNVSFVNVSFNVLVKNSMVKTLVVAPLAYMANGATIENVTIRVSGNATGEDCNIIFADDSYSNNQVGIGLATDCTIVNSSIVLNKTEE